MRVKNINPVILCWKKNFNVENIAINCEKHTRIKQVLTQYKDWKEQKFATHLSKVINKMIV